MAYQQKHELPNKKPHQHDIIFFLKPNYNKNLNNNNNKTKPKPPPSSSSSSSSSGWESFKNLLSCKRTADAVAVALVPAAPAPSSTKKNSRGGAVLGPCSSICSFGGNAAAASSSRRVVHRSDDDDDLPERTGSMAPGPPPPLLVPGKKGGCRNGGGGGGSSSSRWSLGSGSSSSRRMHLKKLSGCYECQAIVDPAARYPMGRRTKCACPDCGEVFPKVESLEHHRAVRHAVLELGPDDSSRNIVEIIFKSSWLMNNNNDNRAWACKIQRILKVHNAPRTIQRFEDYRHAVKIRAAVSGKKSPRCAADGNELLRFYRTTLACDLGARGSSSLCASSLPACGVCTVIRHGFPTDDPAGVRTTASSGGAHGSRGGDGSWAMLVCRVIAGRVGHTAPAADEAKEPSPGDEEDSAAAQTGSFDSVSGWGGLYPNLEELYVFNRRAILPCFVVIYNAIESY